MVIFPPVLETIQDRPTNKHDDKSERNYKQRLDDYFYLHFWFLGLVQIGWYCVEVTV